MLVDQLIAARPLERGMADGFKARAAVDDSLDTKAQEVLLADAAPPVVFFGDEDEQPAAVIPIRKRDALRAAWGAGADMPEADA